MNRQRNKEPERQEGNSGLQRQAMCIIHYRALLDNKLVKVEARTQKIGV